MKFPSIEEAKEYATKKGYRYAHLWYNEAHQCAFYNPFKGSWKKSIDRHEKGCQEAICYGRHIKGLYAPVQWGIV